MLGTAKYDMVAPRRHYCAQEGWENKNTRKPRNESCFSRVVRCGIALDYPSPGDRLI